MVRLIPLANGPDRDRHGRLLRAVEIDGQDGSAQMFEAGVNTRWLDRDAHEDARLAEMLLTRLPKNAPAPDGRGAWTACPDWP